MLSFDRKYEGIAKFPAVNRDLSMVVPKNIMVGQIEEVIEKNGMKGLWLIEERRDLPRFHIRQRH